MTDKNKKRILIAGLGIVCIGLAVGIGIRLYRGGNEVTPVVAEETGQEDEVIIEPFVEPEPAAKEDVVIETEETKAPDEKEQVIQTDPVRTEDDKPTEAPDSQGTDTANQSQKPADQGESTTKTPAPSNNTPKDGDRKDGMIYISGFGWVVDEGGGGEGIFDDQMYENGNKIGIMD